jgi:hypothetical protein
MKRFVSFLAMSILIVTFGSGLSYAQSSGSFNYGTGQTACVLNNDNSGTITGGQQCASNLVFAGTGGTGNCGGLDKNGNPNPPCSCIGSVTTGIKTSSGNGNVFVIRPSAVVGLLTNVTVSKNSTSTTGTSSALAGVDFAVSVLPKSGQPNPTVTPNYPLTYDARFIQLSTNLFDVLGTLCTTTTGCFISFNESTVSAHSFDWVASNLESGVYEVQVGWTSSLGDFGIANSMTCVGPVNLTVQQNKIFSPSAGLSF